MSTRKKLLAAAGVLILIGILLFAVQPGPPDYECAPKGAASSGLVEDDGCAISIESFEKRADYESKPKPFRIAGLAFVVVGLGTGVVGLVRGRSKTDGSTDLA